MTSALLLWRCRFSFTTRLYDVRHMKIRLTHFAAALSAYALLWSVTLLIMLEDDVAMLAFMLS